jgi:hypothetical protein
MKYLLKLIIIPIVYVISFAFLTVGMASIDGFAPIVKSIISIILFIVFAVVIAAVMIKEGQEAYGILLTNNAQRRRIVETGKVVDFDASSEYRPYKGFLAGLICCVPLVIMVIMHLIVAPAGEVSRISIICEMAYGLFFSIFRTYMDTNALGFFLISAGIIVVFPLVTGIPYMVGAARRKLQQDNIRKLNDELHGVKK